MNIQDFGDLNHEPLAGCDEIFNVQGHYISFRDNLLLILQVATARDIGTSFLKLIELEIPADIDPPFEYGINEMMYEIRRHAAGTRHFTSTTPEDLILKNWNKVIAGRSDDDKATNYIIAIKARRLQREKELG
jgi:hypothetical protein